MSSLHLGPPRLRARSVPTVRSKPRLELVRRYHISIPTDRPLCVTPAGNREQRNVDSTSASRQGVATGPIYGLGQITVAQVAAAVLAPTRTPPGPSTPRIRVGGTVRSERSPCLYSVWFDGCRTLSRPVSHAA